jgi:hypothetical protein
VHAVAKGGSAIVSWTAAVPRAGDTAAAYHVSDQPGGATITVPGTGTSATFKGLRAGTHQFAVTVGYAPSRATVAATASNIVVIHRERRHPHDHDGGGGHHHHGSGRMRFL